MNENDLDILQNGEANEICALLQNFAQKNSKLFTFPSFTKALKNKFAKVAADILSSKPEECQIACLTCLCIIARDKNDIEEIACANLMQEILCLAKLSTVTDNCHRTVYPVIIEAQKVLFNLVFNSTEAQQQCLSQGFLDVVIQRLEKYTDDDLPSDVRFYDMRILFLITALRLETRNKLTKELDGIKHLSQVIETLMPNDGDLNDEHVRLFSEILKILFNLTVDRKETNDNQDDEVIFPKVVLIIRCLILKDKHQSLISHCINLLSNMPASTFQHLIADDLEQGQHGNLAVEEIEPLSAILKFLEHLLSRPVDSMDFYECVAPVLMCLCTSCDANKTIRKYIKAKVLPPLQNIHERPEEGTTLRNRLCRMMTSPNIQLKSAAAEFLFILCKRNSKRFVKYTGYGNAAGLLANHGLMLANNQPSLCSSDSECSDTEEYVANKHKINPITGCYEEPHADPMENMSEEQKEYEAMKLVNLMDKLAREKIIQPTKIGPDGKPQPVEHLLELQNSNEEDENED